MDCKNIKLLKPLFLLITMLALVTPAGCDYITGEAIKDPVSQPVITNISPIQANNLIISNKGNSAFIILDVRTAQEYASGHLKGAINLDVNSPDFKEKVDVLNKNNIYLVYCRSGSRSANASKIMAELGFKNIYNMTGGFTEWQEAGLPAIK